MAPFAHKQKGEFISVEIVILAALIGLIPAAIANRKGHSFMGYRFGGLPAVSS